MQRPAVGGAGADLDQSLVAIQPIHWRRIGEMSRVLARPDRAFQRVEGKCVEYVGQQQFLMLLLMLTTQIDQRQQFRRKLLDRAIHRRIHHRAIVENVGQ